jgi:hypothetical protein
MSATTAIHAVWQGGVQPEPPRTWDEQMYVDIPGAESLTHREKIVRELKQHPSLVSQLAVTNFKHRMIYGFENVTGASPCHIKSFLRDTFDANHVPRYSGVGMSA